MTCPSSTYGGGQQANAPWKNYIESVQLTVGTYWTPKSVQDLVHIARRAEFEGKRLHPVGAGYSFEDIAASEQWMVDLRNLNHAIAGLVESDAGLSALTPAWAERQRGRLPNFPDKLVHVEAGIRIFDLCKILDEKDLALPTLGGASGQHLAGAISTSTHGSDLHQSPMCDLVQALHLVTTGGREVWIESSSKPLTRDDAALRRALNSCPDLEVVRSDEVLHSALVAMGRFGVIYSIVLQVSKPRLRLAEFAQRLSWPSVLGALEQLWTPGNRRPFFPLEGLLTDPPPQLQIARGPQDYRYLDLTFNSRKTDSCWVRRRWPSRSTTDLSAPSSTDCLCEKGVANAVLASAGVTLGAYAGLVAAVPVVGLIAPKITVKAAELTAKALHPMTAGEALAAALNAIWECRVEAFGNELFGDVLAKGMDEVTEMTVGSNFQTSSTTGKVGPNWQISAGGADPKDIGTCYRGNSIEVIFGLENRAFLDFLKKVLPEAPKHRQAGYIAVRFSHKSKALLSMHNVNHDLACSIELTSLQGLSGNNAWMEWLEKTAVEMGGRPHWGQQNKLTATAVETLYPVDRLAAWRRSLQSVAGGSGTFSNAYTRRRGLEPPKGPDNTVPLEQYWNEAKADSVLVSSSAGRADVIDAGYRRVRSEGFVFEHRRLHGLVPLVRYWHEGRTDHMLVASEPGIADVSRERYRLVTLEGWVFNEPRPGTVPLEIYWSEQRKDSLTTATESGRASALASGYRLVRTEGFLYPRAIALRTHSGHFVGAESGGGAGVDARRTLPREHETFEVVYLGENRVALRSYLGFYVCAEGGGGGPVVANRTQVGPWETFQLVVAGNRVGLRAANGQFIGADGGGGGAVLANRSELREHESFQWVGV